MFWERSPASSSPPQVPDACLYKDDEQSQDLPLPVDTHASPRAQPTISNLPDSAQRNKDPELPWPFFKGSAVGSLSL
ncbi:hypothetical protein VTL71DRAFT_11006 [Oculimacula yallundae]|uniref:Uncharacterized protein n=1 Tax=Oculimacula yallundae TaxID=86028 RepID=A0ABR4CUY1_9HELO